MGICDNRVVIITGAGGGLGAAHAKVFAEEGASVVVNDINVDAANSVVEEIERQGGKAVANSSDITHYDDSANAVKQAVDSFGGLDVVLNILDSEPGFPSPRSFKWLATVKMDDMYSGFPFTISITSTSVPSVGLSLYERVWLNSQNANHVDQPLS